MERKTAWSLAGHAGEARPDGMQRLLTAAKWDEDLVRDDLRGNVTAALGDPGGVLIDRELYLPRSWTGDQARLAAAKVPGKRDFKTKPQLLRAMIERAIAAGVPFGWVTADEACGDNGPLREFLEEQKLAYVLAVSRDQAITTKAGTWRADAMAAAIPGAAWQRISCGDGAKGRRYYDWVLAATDRPEVSLLVRRSIARPSELAFYLCHAPQPVPLARLVQVAGARWAVEECFQAGKNEAGLDHYQVRLYKAWYRYVTLSMLALAWLAVTRVALADAPAPGLPPEARLITSANEIRRMLAALCSQPPDARHARRWSRWRHRHQERARYCHYQRQRRQDH